VTAECRSILLMYGHLKKRLKFWSTFTSKDCMYMYVCRYMLNILKGILFLINILLF
jgi:hypothetical protein